MFGGSAWQGNDVHSGAHPRVQQVREVSRNVPKKLEKYK